MWPESEATTGTSALAVLSGTHTHTLPLFLSLFSCLYSSHCCFPLHLFFLPSPPSPFLYLFLSISLSLLPFFLSFFLSFSVIHPFINSSVHPLIHPSIHPSTSMFN